MAGETKIGVTGPGGQRKTYKQEDVRPFWVYDTVSIATAATEAVFFQSPQGKVLAETNLTQFSTLPQGWVFDAVKMRFILPQNIDEVDAKALLNTSVLTYLKEGIEEIFTLPAILCGAGGGLYGHLSTTVTASTASVGIGNGLPTQASAMKLPFPLSIVGGRTFQFRLKFESAVTLGATRKCKMVLDGVLRKAVVGA